MTCTLCTAKGFSVFIVVILAYSGLMGYVVFQTYFQTHDELLSHLEHDHHGKAHHSNHQVRYHGEQNINHNGKENSRITPNKLDLVEANVNKPIHIDNEEILDEKISTDLHSSSDTNVTNFRNEELLKVIQEKLKRIGDISVINSPTEEHNKYSVIGCASYGGDYNYMFPLPLTVYAWWRSGYQSIIVLLGEIEEFIHHPVLTHTIQALVHSSATIVFIPARDEHKIMLSQTSRLFVAKMFPWTNMEDAYVITSDADIWPLNGPFYDMSNNSKIVALNSECCGAFQHKGWYYKMLPLCNIGMSIRTWRQVMHHEEGVLLKSGQEILGYVAAEFGDFVWKPVEKGENNGWFLDQHLISVRIFEWTVKHNSSMVQLVRRDTGRDRIDRSYSWWPWKIDGKNDAHILEQAHRPGVWERLRPLLHLMFDENKIAILEDYRSKFLTSIFATKSDKT